MYRREDMTREKKIKQDQVNRMVRAGVNRLDAVAIVHCDDEERVDVIRAQYTWEQLYVPRAN